MRKYGWLLLSLLVVCPLGAANPTWVQYAPGGQLIARTILPANSTCPSMNGVAMTPRGATADVTPVVVHGPGVHLGELERRLLHAHGEAPPGRAVDFHPRKPRDLFARRRGVVPVSRRRRVRIDMRDAHGAVQRQRRRDAVPR